MFDLRDIVAYIAKRVGLIPVRYGSKLAIRLTCPSRPGSGAISLRFLNRHELKRFLAFDDFHKGQPEGG